MMPDAATLPHKNRKWTREAYRACAAAGMTVKATAELLGRTPEGVMSMARDAKLQFADYPPRKPVVPPVPKVERKRLGHEARNGVSLAGIPMDAPDDFPRIDETAPRATLVRVPARPDRVPLVATLFTRELRRQVQRVREA